MAPGSHPARVKGEDNGSRLLDMKACRFRHIYSLDVFLKVLCRGSVEDKRRKGPTHPS